MTLPNELKTSNGFPLPLGANVRKNGVQFSLLSRNATSVTLVLFHNEDQESPWEEVLLDPVFNKTGDIWHIFIDDLSEGQLYCYKIDGPYDPEEGHRYNKNKLLLDPYARALTDNFLWDLSKARGFDPLSSDLDQSFSWESSGQYVPRCIVINNRVNYIDDIPLNLPDQDLIIYELHLKGFTKDDSSCVEHKGTYRGLMEKIPYLKELGINAVELLPIQEFDELENINHNPETGERLKNFWGYSTLAFFAPKATYSSSGVMGEQITEFKEMVKAFHDAGIEVILDVVFNHTAEGDQMGPTISFRGIDNSIYYILEDNKRLYKNYSGCGNTFNCNHPLVRDFILDCLRYWAVEMKVDGFRFDLASILGRDQYGNILSNPPLIERIEEDPILRNTKIIAEAWDAAGAYQVGKFSGRWAEWNGKYRDDIRLFWKGEPNTIGIFATRLTGSSDIYHRPDRGPQHSINFITCHDGFTLNDLVSYNNKHNLQNGEQNRDGENHNISNNFGIEGVSETDLIDRVRIKQIKNFLATLYLSQGVPMLLGGDEFRRTQQGNNNAYCQDNEISWVDWALLNENKDIYSFTKFLIHFRKEHSILRRTSFLTGKKQEGFGYPDIEWHGAEVNHPQWDPKSHSLAMLLNGEYALKEGCKRENDLYAIFNASLKPGTFKLPPAPNGKPWRLIFDTAKDDYLDGENIVEKSYFVEGLSSVLLSTSEYKV